MNVDLDAIAQRGRCEVSSLRLALPLIEQGYTPPFLARYRRDELGGLDESSLWALSHAVRTQQQLDEYREQLHTAWKATQLADPAIGRAISNAKSRRLLDRLSRRVKAESNESGSLTQRLAVRVMSPQKGDGDNLEAIAAGLMQSAAEATPKPALSETESAETESAEAEASETDSAEATPDAESTASAPSAESAIAKLDDALAKRMSGDPRIIGAAVRWLARNAKIHIVDVTDPHGGDDGEDEPAKSEKKGKKKKKGKAATAADEATSDDKPAEIKAAESKTADAEVAEANASDTEPAETPATETTAAENPTTEAAATETAASETPAEPVAETSAEPARETSTSETPVAEGSPAEAPAAEPAPAADSSPASDASSADAPAVETPAAEPNAVTEPTVEAAALTEPADAPADTQSAETQSAEPKAAASEKKAAPAAKPKKKKISPRQRRRRWLVSTLKPLSGKRMPAGKLSAFQVVMLSRALRSQVATCAFDYDAAQLVAEVQKAASNLNRHFSERLAAVVLANEATLRDAAESAWWDEIQEQASSRLVSIAADNLHRQINRGGVEAKVVMSIDAIGPRTAATSIVAADGRVLHNEDIPCQLSAAMRTLAVTKMGELIHKYHVDLIVISNGPARRACMIAVGELIKQSADQSVRWTLADRSGADAYAGSAAGDQEMRATPRRFRSAAWIAFSTLQPSQAMVKVDPLKLRLGSFQRELSDQAVLDALEDVLVSGAARGGVDVNSTTASWLERLPGMTSATAEKIDTERREKLISSRDDLLARADWESPIHTRQALPFLRVFGSEETLDGTLIHPDDYALAKRLAKALEIELPPQTPPGYELPDYSEPKPTGADPATEDAVASGAEDGEPSSAEAATAETQSFGPTETNDAEESTADAGGESEDVVSAETPAGETAPEAAADDAEAKPDGEESSEGEPKAEAAADDNAEASAGEDAAAEASDESAEPPDASAGENAEPAAAEHPAPSVPEPFRQPKPERAKVDKLVKEWQVGVRRSKQIVDWLCEPFGEGTIDGAAPAVMTTMPALNELKEGDQVIGVVVGVMPFGVFVELTPECSGLIHVSRISDGFVEDLHEAVQVGDVVTAWVTGIDSKRRRVGLSAISPQREAELQARRHDSRSSRGGQGHSGPGRGGQGRGGQARGGQGRGGQGGQGQGRGPQNRKQGAGGNESGGPPRGRGGGQSDRSGGGPRRDGRGGGRDGGRGRAGGGRRDQRGGRGPRRPEVYEVVGKEPDSAPLSDAMQEGKEPLRSFGDLMQLFNKDKAKPADAKASEAKPSESKPSDSKPAEEKPAESKSEEPKQAEAKPADAAPPAEESKPVAEATSEAPAAAVSDNNPSAGENA